MSSLEALGISSMKERNVYFKNYSNIIRKSTKFDIHVFGNNSNADFLRLFFGTSTNFDQIPFSFYEWQKKSLHSTIHYGADTHL